MKKLLLKVLLVTFVLSAGLFDSLAQEQAFEKGDNDLSIGMGFGTTWLSSGYSTLLPPISVSFDHGLRDDWGPGVFGIGGYVGTSLYRQKFTFGGETYGYNYTTMIFAARATYHYTFVDKLDTYGGGILGFRITGNSSYGTWPGGVSADPDNNFAIANSLFVGARYYFSDAFSAYSELGYGIAYLTIGVTFKF